MKPLTIKNGFNPPDFYKKIPLKLVFYCKHDFKMKEIFFAGGNRTDPPKDTTYRSMVSLSGLRITTFIGELNDMSIKTGDIGNYYLE